VALLSMFIGACVGCTCESSWSICPVQRVDAAVRAARAWWRCIVEVAGSDGSGGLLVVGYPVV
jgi:hypothetical protein